MKKQNICTKSRFVGFDKPAFSLIELIIVVSIILLIGAIGLSINNNYTQRSKNSKITSDIQTIKNSFEANLSETKTLPDPDGNLKYFSASSDYLHHDDANVYGVYGNITENTLPKKYLDFVPIDPRNNQYYAYGKTLAGNLSFEVSGVNQVNGVYQAKVVGNHVGDQVGPYNLIREYNGPDFVYDLSDKNFPYNPDEKVMRGKIGFFSGVVNINGENININSINNKELVSGDVIKVSAGGQAVIYFSDGSKSYLGDPAKESQLTIANMFYKGENNLLTKIQLALDFGTIWTKTSKLNTESEFEIYTNNTEAAVRGTIFKVEKTDDSNTIVKVVKGVVDVYRYSSVNDLVNKIKSNTPLNNGISPEVLSGDDTTIVPPYLHDDDGLANTWLFIKSINNGKVEINLPKGFNLNNKVVINNETNEVGQDSYTFSDGLITFNNLDGTTNSIKICNSQKTKCTKNVFIDTTLTYEQTKNDADSVLEAVNNQDCIQDGKSVYFGKDVGCVSPDDSLADDYKLVAYAPYDTDFNLYTFIDGKTGTIEADQSGISIEPISGNNKGVFIGDGDKLKYNGINTLSLGENYAIEIKVRGEAIKRNEVQLFDSSNRVRGFNSMTNPSLLFIIPKTNIGVNTIELDWNTFEFDQDKYYSFFFKSNGSEGSINLISNIKYEKNEILQNPKNLGNELYIGSSSVIGDQWNDIIDYIKVYKKGEITN